MYTKKLFIVAIALFSLLSGCQTAKEYHDTLIDTSLACEIPTLLGNLAGGIAGVPFLLITAPAGYLLYPDREEDIEKSQKERSSFILAPINVSSHSLGIVLGTPFYPIGLLFPREKPEKE